MHYNFSVYEKSVIIESSKTMFCNSTFLTPIAVRVNWVLGGKAFLLLDTHVHSRNINYVPEIAKTIIQKCKK